MTADLFGPFDLAGLALLNRIVMAPMTRTRASASGVQGALNADYYAERASAGLIVTECTAVSPESAGIMRAPGIYTDAQAEGWREVVDAVHQNGGRIYLQIWHCGRVSHTDLQPDGGLPVAPSAIAAQGQIFTPNGRLDYPVPRALELGEIAGIVESFRRGAERAKAAGFDGVELHGAFGYLPDQFLQDGTNKRDDAYGGSVRNRARFMLEIVEGMVSVWGAERVGVKLSPSNRFYGMFDSDPVATFGHVLSALDELGIGYVHLMQPNDGDRKSGTVQVDDVVRTFRPFFIRGAVIANGGFDKARANAIIADGSADLVSFGVPFLANPDLPLRLSRDAPLNTPDPATFYGEGPKGYVDYPTLEGAKAAA
jgi:N-ethylmaleimide reductase